MNPTTAILSTIHYSDIFDYPLTAAEIHRRLLSVALPLEEVERLLTTIPAVHEKDGYYFTAGRTPLVPVRQKREALSRKKIRKLWLGLNLLRLIPWIKLVGITGSVAAGNAQPDDDVDLLIVTSPKRLWLSRLSATLVLDLFRLRRRKGDQEVSNKLCLNMFLTEDHLKLDEDVYTAYELIQLKPMWWKENVYRELFLKNEWVSKLLPNYIIPKPRTLMVPAGVIRLPLLNLLEQFLFKVQKRRMHIRGNEIVKQSEIRFHPLNTKLWILNEFYLRTNVKLS